MLPELISVKEIERRSKAFDRAKLETFAMHAPFNPQPWFEPVIDRQIDKSGPEYFRQRLIQWPFAWARAVLAAEAETEVRNATD